MKTVGLYKPVRDNINEKKVQDQTIKMLLNVKPLKETRTNTSGSNKCTDWKMMVWRNSCKKE
jgi:hypothetical protein